MHAALILLPDFALILLGCALRRAMHLGDHFWTGLEKLIYYILFPALLFNAVARTPIDVGAAAPLIAVAGLALAGSMALGLGARLFSLSPISFASQFQCAFRYNAYIGLAVVGTLHGAAGIAAMGLILGTMVIPANVAAVGMLARHQRLGVWGELARNPLILATLSGLAWNLAGLPLPEPALKVFGRLSEASIALGLLTVGAALKLRGLEGDAGTRGAAVYLLAVKLGAMPAIALAGSRLMGLSGVYADTVLVFAALPTATSAYILAQRMGGDGARVAWLISASTLLAMLTLPLWLSLRN